MTDDKIINIDDYKTKKLTVDDFTMEPDELHAKESDTHEICFFIPLPVNIGFNKKVGKINQEYHAKSLMDLTELWGQSTVIDAIIETWINGIDGVFDELGDEWDVPVMHRYTTQR